MDILGQEEFILRPGSKKVLKIAATVCSSATANDGSVPYGRTVSSVSATYRDKSGDEASDLENNSASVADNVISLDLKYPSTSGEGKYSVYLLLTLDDGQVLAKVIKNKIIAEDN